MRQLRHPRGGRHGEVHRRTGAGGLAPGDEGARGRQIGRERLFQQHCPPGGQGGIGQRDVMGGRGGDIEAVARGDDGSGAVQHGHIGGGVVQACAGFIGRVPDRDGGHEIRRMAQRRAKEAFAHDAESDNAEFDGGGHGGFS